VTVGEVAAGYAYACTPDENIQRALSTMRTQRVRRLPVVDGDGMLAGIISIDDVVLRAKDKKGSHNSVVTYADVVETQKAIAERWAPVHAEERAAAAAANAAPAHVGDFDFEE
jgi:CBS domain-containing protein